MFKEPLKECPQVHPNTMSIRTFAIFLWYSNTIITTHVIVSNRNINDNNAVMPIFLFDTLKYFFWSEKNGV